MEPANATVVEMNKETDTAEATKNGPAADSGKQVAADNNNGNNNEIHSPTPPATNNNVKQAIYDVLGSNDQELARRQYADDDDDESDNDDDHVNGPLAKRKRLALSYSSRAETNLAGDNDNDISNGTNSTNGSRPVDENCLSNSSSSINGYQSDCNNMLDSGNTRMTTATTTTTVPDQSTESKRSSSSSDEPEQMRKLFIGGLDYKTSEETLKQHFEKFGDVNDCVVMREPQSKRSRGFGFVIYANSSMVDRAQQARPHEVDGREVQSKRAISREDSGKPEAQATVKKVYLGGLSDDIEESELRDYFNEFGNIVNINIVAHKDTGKKRGFAFVEYDDYDPVDKIVLKKFHTIKDKRIEAKKAIPKPEMDAARRRGDPRVSMAGAMMALAGGPPLDGSSSRSRPGRNSAGSNAYLWGSAAYGSGSAYPAGYTGQVNYGYPPHYHSPSAHYGSDSWMMHGGQAGGGGNPYGFRGAHGGGFYGRSGYSNPPVGAAGGSGGGGSVSGGTGYAGSATDYGVASFPASLGGTSGGPMRLSYQHRSLGPYGTGYGAHRGRG